MTHGTRAEKYITLFCASAFPRTPNIGSEVPFVFGDDFELSTKGEHTLSNAMGCYWVNFAASGNPNKGPSGCSQTLKLPEWPSIGASNNVLVMSNTSIAAKPGFKSTQCDLYATYP